jgi:uncharacterized protein (TIGR02246 family)
LGCASIPEWPLSGEPWQNRDGVMDEAKSEALVQEMEIAWNTHDMRRFAARFAEDADFVNVAGSWMRGRDDIEAKHAASHAGRFKDSTMRMRLASVKEIAPGVGVIHVTWQLEGHTESGPRRTTDTPRGIWTWTVRDRGTQLEIVAAHNTDTLASPP